MKITKQLSKEPHSSSITFPPVDTLVSEISITQETTDEVIPTIKEVKQGKTSREDSISTIFSYDSFNMTIYYIFII